MSNINMLKDRLKECEQIEKKAVYPVSKLIAHYLLIRLKLKLLKLIKYENRF